LACSQGPVFTLGLGSGERLNEHIIGAGWPGRVERHERFGEAIDIIQGLLSGTLTNYRGRYYQLDHARLFDRPKSKVPVAVAAGGQHAAGLAGEKGDALITTEPRSELIEAYEAGGGKGPRYAEVAICYAPRDDDAKKTAHRLFRWSLPGWPVMAELPDPEGFAAASKNISPDAVAEAIPCGPEPTRHLDAVNAYIKAGYDHIILTQIGPMQDEFLDFFRRELAEPLRQSAFTPVVPHPCRPPDARETIRRGATYEETR
jgi:G6PDH family F420-dependent oxidoreductase